MTAIALTYDVDATFGCHLWTGKLGDNGRPIIWRGKRPSSAYKIAYEQAGLVVPAEHALDHLCRRERCVNPVHLEPVTKAENERRKSWAYRCKRTRCAHGHDLSDALVTPEMGRLCRTCHRLADVQGSTSRSLTSRSSSLTTPPPRGYALGGHRL